MIDQSTFIEYLTATPEPQEITFSHIGPLGVNAEQWVINVATKPEAEQCAQLEKTLSELILVQIPEEQLLKIMLPVFKATERLIAQMRNSYKYEAGALTLEHQAAVERVKSLYYMSILVFNGLIERLLAKRLPPSSAEAVSWARLLPIARTSPNSNNLAVAIYWTILCYQKLLLEFAVAYQRLPPILWQQLNRLYLLAVNEDVVKVDISRHPIVNSSSTIHQLYTQVCLFNLLNLTTYRRQDITGIHRLLPKWASYLKITLLPESKTRLFINLQGDKGPEYLTPNTPINPYDDENTCLFIELPPLLAYLQNPRQGGKVIDSYEQRLMEQTVVTLEHQYLKPQRRATARKTVNHKATLITEFNRIHYHIAGKTSLGNLIQQKNLPEMYLPKYTTRPRRGTEDVMIRVKLLDQSLGGYRFRTTDVLNMLSEIPMEEAPAEAPRPMLTIPNDPSGSWLLDSLDTGNRVMATSEFAPPVLQVMSLFAIHNDLEKNSKKWEVGLVRWIEAADEQIEVGAQLLGRSVTACGIRLDNNDGRSQDFVAALLIAGNADLNTKSSLMMPRYHFKEGDRVVLRIQDKQTRLSLRTNILNTDDIDQYEIAKLAS
jgi:hypothetical protein